MIVGPLLLLAGLILMLYSWGLLGWTTIIRNRAHPEPQWVIPAGCTTSILAVVLCVTGIIVSALTF